MDSIAILAAANHPQHRSYRAFREMSKRTCDGDLVTGAPCNVSIRGRCKHDARCNERRCASHCKCARMGWRTGRSRGRSAVAAPPPAPKAKAKAKAKAVAPPPPVHVPGPIGPMPQLSIEMMTPQVFSAAMIEAVRTASCVIAGSYQFGHSGLQDMFLQRLGDRSAFELTLLIDKEMVENATPHCQKTILNRDDQCSHQQRRRREGLHCLGERHHGQGEQ